MIIDAAVVIPDMYLRLHYQYYTDMGILITHPLYTAKNYLTTTFITDLSSSLPLHLLGFESLFGKKYQIITRVFLISLFRPLGFYRIYGLLTYLQFFCPWILVQTIRVCKFLLTILVAVTILAYVDFHVKCKYKNGNLTCDENSWIAHSNFSNQINNVSITLLCSYFSIIMTLTGTSNLYVELVNETDVVWFLTVLFICYVLRLNIVGVLCCAGVNL